MSWLKNRLNHKHINPDLPPEWSAAPEASRTYGLYNEAPKDEYEAAEAFCNRNPPDRPRFLPSADIERINLQGGKAWTLVQPSLSRFRGRIRDVHASSKGGPKVVELETDKDCGDTCVFSNYPLIAGLYDIQGKEGVYYETTILQMDGTTAIGLACKPYPEYRLPGWNRLSVALHLDDLHKFFEDPDGGRPYSGFPPGASIKEGDTIGCGYRFQDGSVFFTYNGQFLGNAFVGLFLPKESYYIYAAIGVGGPGRNKIRVNFGGDNTDNLVRWIPGREWSWLAEGHVGRMVQYRIVNEELPAYTL